MSVRILTGHALDKLAELEPESVHCVVTSPPYFNLRDYGLEPQTWPDGWIGSLGAEPTVDLFVSHLVAVFAAVRRVLRRDGCLFANLSDSYAGGGRGGHSTGLNGTPPQGKGNAYPKSTVPDGIPAKNLLLVPDRFRLAMQRDGWWIRSVMPWIKRGAMPESVTDRPASSVESFMLFTKAPRYFWDPIAVRRAGAAYQVKAPDGWDTGPGAHGTVHRNGREKGKRTDEERSGRNMRNGDLMFDSLGLILDEDGDPLALDVNPAPWKLAHFATFPPKLVRPLILAGTSEKGCCAACGAPWVRQTSKTFVPQPDVSAERNAFRGKVAAENGWAGFPRGTTSSETTGWAASCSCDAAVVPCQVLDIFAGSGTTGLVADQLGRDAVLIDLHPSYVTMAADRVTGDAPLFADVEVEP